ncbi:MAG: hypothetical protein J7J15_02200 [Candidatus Aenigmarchaeota archaeon]|nr:hypothetical protein [Candidatus Aenigmarchaeota archaeon]
MENIIFEDNLAYPKEKEIIKYHGEEPFRLYFQMSHIFKDILEVMGKDINEIKIKWDATSLDKSFYVKWKVKRKIDTWTSAFYEVVAQGKQNSQTRKGEITIALVPSFRTEVKVNFLQKTFWWIYYFIYYKKKRNRDFLYAKNLANKLKLAIANLYGIKAMESV